MEQNSDTKSFDSASALIDYLGIGRPTFYRRAKALNISTSKGIYTSRELGLLKEPLSNAPKNKNASSYKDDIKELTEQIEQYQKQLEQDKSTIEQQQEQLSEKDEALRQAPSAEYIELLKHSTETAENTVKNTNEQLRAKDTQLTALTKALDQSQRLQSDLQMKLDKARLELETVQQYNSSEPVTKTEGNQEQVNRTQSNTEQKGFWSRLMGFK